MENRKVQIKTNPWPRDTAGHNMMTAVPFIRLDDTIETLHQTIVANIKKIETLHYIYVIDDLKRLVGVLSIEDLFRHSPTTKVRDIAKTEHLVTVKPKTDQERVVYKALQHNLKAIPVIDKNKTFLGIIPSDTILHILYKEAHEDLLRLAGIHARHTLFDNVLTLPILSSVKHRLPWLILGLAGGLLSARIINGFARIIENNLILAAFIPLIVYMSGAVGTQMVAFVIRDVAIDRKLRMLRYFLRQLFVIAIIALICGAALFVWSMFVYKSLVLSKTLAFALGIAIVSSVGTGLLIPFFFMRFRMDPANASGPIATIIQDLFSIIIYFSIASWLL